MVNRSQSRTPPSVDWVYCYRSRCSHVQHDGTTSLESTLMSFNVVCRIRTKLHSLVHMTLKTNTPVFTINEVQPYSRKGNQPNNCLRGLFTLQFCKMGVLSPRGSIYRAKGSLSGVNKYRVRQISSAVWGSTYRRMHRVRNITIQGA